MDGGMSTALESMGADLSCNLWTAKCLFETPELIKDAHKAFYLSGSDIAITSSYQTSVDLLMRECNLQTPQEAYQLMSRSVDIADQARREA